MSRKILSAASTTKLIALATVKDRLGITSSSQDTRLGELISEASSAIEDYIGRPLVRQRYLETVSGNARGRIMLSCCPLDRDSVTLTIDDVADTDFAVENWESGFLWRDGGADWPRGERSGVISERPEENLDVTYKGGYILPDMISAFAASVPILAGAWVRPTTPVGDLLMEVTTGGTPTGSEPTWPTSAGTTVTSGGGGVVFTARHAYELPKFVLTAAWLLIHDLHTSMTRGVGVRAVESDNQRIEYFSAGSGAEGIPGRVARMIDGMRIAG